MPSTLVMKFGGTSVGTPEAMAQAVANIRQSQKDWERIVVVASALSGVTNLLTESAQRAIQSDEVFISHEAANNGIEIENTGDEPLVSLRYFGPDTHNNLPLMSDKKR